MKTTRFAAESAAQAQAKAQKPFKDINWAVREICVAYGNAPSCTGGTAELADILRELLEAHDNRKSQPEWLSQALNEGDGVYRP